ncbi:MAG: hybrid sensor histidine kinase/response regulator [Deltaproteobacteria bacterium HGW-Deltaproteobacteria-9]|nr:MAG: hybrid sensor histidine kinase/response regulator [Deltaproteobacteria bacterium HGW-Deltaproteobacteria-9]
MYTHEPRRFDPEEVNLLSELADDLAYGIMSMRTREERKKAEAALVESERRMSDIIDFLPDATFVTDLEGRIIAWNKATEEMTGVPAEQMMGKGNYEYSLPFYGVRRPILIDFVFVPHEEIRKEYHFLEKKGALLMSEADVPIPGRETRVLWGTAGPLFDGKGNVVGAIESLRDITDHKKLQAQFYQAQKMEAIGTLAGGIAHDFNNILTGIMGYTELLLMTYKTDGKLQNYLGQIHQAGERARSLVQQILTISRRVEQKIQPMEVAPVVREVLKLLRSSLPTTIEIRQDIAISSGKGIVVADPTQIHQVLMNLCTNAAHAMRTKGGVLSVSLSEVEVDTMTIFSRDKSLQAGPYVKLTVSDTGHGMDAAVRDRIFEPYFTTKEIGEGTGLGLAVVLGISKNYGGAVTVYSEPSKGTTFDVLLPATKQDVEQRIESAEALHGGNERILFIDDEEIVVNLGKTILESLGYAVTAKTNSLEALEVFRACPDAYDLVITDMTMPGMTGIDIATALMVIRTDIPIILCTGYSDLINADQAKEEGMRDFIMKPFVISKLAQSIRKVLEKK